MQAVTIDEYGPAENLHFRELPRPTCGENQVLLRVRAAGVNPIDWRIRKGSLRMLLPARFPLVLGFDVAGEIVEVGQQAKHKGWRVGDEVFSFLDNRHGGGYAEFAVAGADVLARKPPSVSFTDAAAVPLAASTALQALRDHGKLQVGHDLLVNGASGGVGSLAVQIGKAMSANVTGVCSESNLDFIRQLGADQAVDYHREDFTDQSHRYDTILDAVAKSSYWKCRRVLKPHGGYITTVPSIGGVTFQCLNLLLSRRCRIILARPRGEDLQQIAQMMADGKLRPVVQDVYPLKEAATAHRVSEAGHVRGKLVLSI
jgi:NADPH:quinone reductase-like Zn-dependent oxidoreductase